MPDQDDSEVTRIRDDLAQEWRSRTWWGKLWFPFWVIKVFTVLGTVFFVMGGFGILIKALLERLSRPFRKGGSALKQKIHDITPETYHDQ